MPVNKNALIRYKTIDACLGNRYRKWTLEDLVNACADALYEMEGVEGVSVRTIQGDIQVMRSDKLGYNAPIEVYENKYYRYSDPEYSITNMPLSQSDLSVLMEAVGLLSQFTEFKYLTEFSDVAGRLQDKLALAVSGRKPIIHFDSVPGLKGLCFISPLYDYILKKQSLRITYQSFTAIKPHTFVVYPYLLKEYRNRWFLYCSRMHKLELNNLALDRIISIEPVEAQFRENPRFDAEHFFDDLVGVSKDVSTTAREVRFRVSARELNYLLTKPIHSSQRIISQEDDGSAVLGINVVVNKELFSVFLSHGAEIEVLSPRDVRCYIKKQLMKGLSRYEGVRD